MGKEQIAKGIQQANLYNAIVNLSNGSISCVCFGEGGNGGLLCVLEHYLLSLNGVLAIKGENRYFTQSFILEKLSS